MVLKLYGEERELLKKILEHKSDLNDYINNEAKNDFLEFDKLIKNLNLNHMFRSFNVNDEYDVTLGINAITYFEREKEYEKFHGRDINIINSGIIANNNSNVGNVKLINNSRDMRIFSD